MRAPSLLEGLALLSLLPATARLEPSGMDAGVDRLEELLTHGPGAPGLVRLWLRELLTT